MDIDNLKNLILKDAVHEDLLPTAMILKYDVTLEVLMNVLKDLLSEKYLVLTGEKWLRITEKGEQHIEKIDTEMSDRIGYRNSSYIDDFFCRNICLEVNEPYLPSLEACKKIIEGECQKETSNKK